MKLEETYFVKTILDYNFVSKELPALLKSTEKAPSGKNRSGCPIWVTDVTFMSDCMKLVISTTQRTLHFYDISASSHMEEFRLSGLPDIPTNMVYWHDQQQETSLLLVGDEGGGVVVFKFSEPETLLFRKMEMGQVEKIHFQNLDAHFRYVSVKHLQQLHTDSINKVQFDWTRQSVITCSDDSSCSVSIFDLTYVRPNYNFCQPKGARCFDVWMERALLVTGGRDAAIRLWTIYAPTQPTAILKGHVSTVIDLRLGISRGLIISLSQDAVVIAWTLDTGQRLQTLPLSFPVPSIRSEELVFGSLPLHTDTPRESGILVTCSEWVTELLFSNDPSEKFLPVTEEYQIQKSSSKTHDNGSGTHLTSAATFPAGNNGFEHCSQRELKLTPNELQQLRRDEDVAFQKMMHHLFSRSHVRLPAAPSREKMRQLVEDGGAHWSLHLTSLQTIIFRPDLPMSTRMRERRLVCNTENDLLTLPVSSFTATSFGLRTEERENGRRTSRTSSITSVNIKKSLNVL